MVKGTLRVYLGAAPGVGKTYAMLNEGRRRLERGSDVVVGYLETHGRVNTAAQARDLEVVPRRTVHYRDTTVEEMDVDAIIARAPEVALVDELAHSNVDGCKNAKRWQDIDDLLNAGIDVVTTVNVQHLESLNDVVQRITGVVQRETVPDDVVRRADQIELVDMSPEALRRRMAHGNIYPAERIDAALGNYFRAGNLGALRELALLWVADRVEDSLHDYLVAHGIENTWETRERIVVAITGAPGGAVVIRRAARLAGRLGGDVLGVRVVASDGLSASVGPELEEQRRLLAEVRGRYHEVVGDDVATALVAFARSEKATQLVVGASRRTWFEHLRKGSVVREILRRSDAIDVHVIAGDGGRPSSRPLPRLRSAVPPRRRLAGIALGLVGLPMLTAVGVAEGEHLELSTVLLIAVAMVVFVSAVGGFGAGVVAAVLAFLLTNWYFVPPVHTFTITEGENIVALIVFLLVSLTVSGLVQRTMRRSTEALRARSEAEALARTTAVLVGDSDPIQALLTQIRSIFSFDAASVISRTGDGAWTIDAAVGDEPPTAPIDGRSFGLTNDSTTMLVARGPAITDDDLRVLRIFTDQLSIALASRRLHEQASAAIPLAERDGLRTAMLQAVSHDLRTPLASIKASVTSLQQDDVVWTSSDRAALLGTINVETDRLNRLVGNLLDMSRLQAGALGLQLGDAGLEDVVGSALASIDTTDADLRVAVDETLPLVRVDSMLLERVVANVVSNAIHWSSGAPVVVSAGTVGSYVHLRVIDSGPGISEELRSKVLEPFQRLGDSPNGSGVGLGLAVSNGFVSAMGGELYLDDTPGGGLTVTISLPCASSLSANAVSVDVVDNQTVAS